MKNKAQYNKNPMIPYDTIKSLYDAPPSFIPYFVLASLPNPK